MKYQHAEALALALHSCQPKNANASEGAVFMHIVSTVAAFVEAQPTLYGGKRFTEVALNGKPASPPTLQANTSTPLPSVLPDTLTINNGIPIVDERGNLLGYTVDAAPVPDPKAEAKAKRAERRAKRQAEADAALLAAMVASTGQSAITLP